MASLRERITAIGPTRRRQIGIRRRHSLVPEEGVVLGDGSGVWPLPRGRRPGHGRAGEGGGTAYGHPLTAPRGVVRSGGGWTTPTLSKVVPEVGVVLGEKLRCVAVAVGVAGPAMAGPERAGGRPTATRRFRRAAAAAGRERTCRQQR